MGRAAQFANQGLKIRLVRYGCTNRPFYHITVAKAYRARTAKPLDTIGTYDPLPNDHGEKLVAINFERLHQWIKKGAFTTRPMAVLLGLAGFFPIHPMTELMTIRNKKNQEWIQRKHTSNNDEAADGEAADGEAADGEAADGEAADGEAEESAV